uniref:R3H domain-containing protein n=1 Tax=Periophthalmus magnuspinnatus TaxID=409849 RepID=A0A3B3ZYB2_9GOBI
MAFPCIDGVYLPKHESEFVHLVLEELDTFEQEDQRSRVLLFPPFPSRLRYLTHRTVEDRPELCSFSVGEGLLRRVAVCFCDIRPDQPLYLPRAVRERQRGAGRGGGRGVREETGEGGVREEERGEIVARERQRGPEGGGSEGENRGNTTVREGEKRREEGGVREEQRGADTTVREEQRREEGVREREQRRESEGVRERLEDGNALSDSPCVSDVSYQMPTPYVVSDALPVCQMLSYTVLSPPPQIRAHVKGGVSFCVDPVHSDFSSFESVSVNSEEFSHVIEIYDFPVLFKTEDLLDAFTEYSDGGMKIKWVDNTHALGIFSCEAADNFSFLQPVKERPRTDCAVARRMVTRALGLQRRGPRY